MFRFPWNRSSAPRKLNSRPAHRRTRKLHCDQLEKRELLAADLVSATLFEGSSGDGDVVNDAAGNTYVSHADTFAKYDPAGQLVWSYATEEAAALAVGPSGALYFAGKLTNGVTIGGHVLTQDDGFSDWFAGRVNVQGSIDWVGVIKTTPRVYDPESFRLSLAVDEQREQLYIAGTTWTTIGSGATVAGVNFRDPNNLTAWMSSARASGQISTYTAAYANDIAVDSTGALYVVGNFFGKVDFDPGSGVSNLTSGSGSTSPSAGFVWKLTSAGSLVWTKAFPGSAKGNSQAWSIALDPRGTSATDDRLVIAGNFAGNLDFDPGKSTLNLPNAGGTDIFVLGFSQDGSLARNTDGRYALAFSFGTTADERYPTIALDNQGSIYVAARQRSASGDSIIVSKYSNAGVVQPWSVRLNCPEIYEGSLDLSLNFATGTLNLTGASVGSIDADGDGDIDLVDATPLAGLDHFWSSYSL